MDKALDEIITTRGKHGPRRGAGSRRGSPRTQVLGTPTISPASRARATAPRTVPTQGVPAQNQQPADKIIVSNLPQDVNETQVRELFQSTVGPLKEVTLHYDSTGRSKGIAAVHFAKRGDGTKAYQQYNNRLIDGKRPMKIEIIVDPSRPATLASRVAPAAAAAAPAAARNGDAPKSVRGTPGGKRGGRGRGGKEPAAGGRTKVERPVKTAADLDAEMENYAASNTPAAPAAA